jgi:hypothetical protein
MLPRLLLALIACGKGRRTQLSDYTGLIGAWQCADITQKTFLHPLRSLIGKVSAIMLRPARRGSAPAQMPVPVGRSQVVRQRILIPPFGGSNPPAPANIRTLTGKAALFAEIVFAGHTDELPLHPGAAEG